MEFIQYFSESDTATYQKRHQIGKNERFDDLQVIESKQLGWIAQLVEQRTEKSKSFIFNTLQRLS
jgi:hypothetical protein